MNITNQQYQDMLLLLQYGLIGGTISWVFRYIAIRIPSLWLLDVVSYSLGILTAISMSAALLLSEFALTLWSAFFLAAVNMFLIFTIVRFLLQRTKKH
jgi:hypothetical protein